MNNALRQLAQGYFHQDYQDDADEPIELVERFRDNEPAEAVSSLRSEIATLIASDATEEDLSRIWVVDADAYFDPGDDDMTMREWLRRIAEVLEKKPEGSPPAAGTATSPDSTPGIPFKGTPGV